MNPPVLLQSHDSCYTVGKAIHQQLASVVITHRSQFCDSTCLYSSRWYGWLFSALPHISKCTGLPKLLTLLSFNFFKIFFHEDLLCTPSGSGSGMLDFFSFNSPGQFEPLRPPSIWTENVHTSEVMQTAGKSIPAAIRTPTLSRKGHDDIGCGGRTGKRVRCQCDKLGFSSSVWTC